MRREDRPVRATPEPLAKVNTPNPPAAMRSTNAGMAITEASRSSTPAQHPDNPAKADMSRREELREHLQLLFGVLTGYLHLARGRSRMTGSEKQWLEQSFRHPEQLEQALNFLELNDEQGYDVYVCPYLGGTQNRTKGGSVSRSLVHVDVDRELRVEEAAELGGFVVWSGSPGRAHVYVPLTRSVSLEEHELLCRGLVERFGGDASKVSDNDLLRPAGTRNYKVAGSPTPVWLELPPGLPPRTPEDLAAQLHIDTTHPNKTLRESQEREDPLSPVIPVVTHLSALNRLSITYAKLVTTGDHPKHPSASEARMAVTLHAHRRGLSIEEFATIALDPHHGMSKWYRNRGRKLLDKEWAKAVKKAAEPQPEVSDKLKAISSVALVTPFPGRGGVSEYAVLHGILTRAREVNKNDLDISVRTAAIYANVSQNTAARAIKRLEEAGWLQLLREADAPSRLAAKYRLTVPTPEGAIPGSPESSEAQDLPRSDYWIKAGTSALQLFHRLLHTPVTQAELVEATGRSRNNVHKHLQLLRADGLLVQAEDERWHVASRDTEHLSVRYGWQGAAQVRIDRHQAQRAGWDIRVRSNTTWMQQQTASKEGSSDQP